MASSNPEAEKYRLEGNEHFKVGAFEKAINSYSKALEVEPSASIYSNRAFANLKLVFSGAALADADDALAIDPGFVKARYRKATAYLQLGKVKQALGEYRAVVAQVPTDTDAQARVKECEKMWKQIQFAKAIESEDSVPLYVKYAKEVIPVPSSYAGPRMEGDVLTLEFVQAMMQRFKEQSLISKKDLVSILLQSREVLASQPNVTPITVPDDGHFTVCGDTHGQYYDTLNIFEKNGMPSTTNPYLFNGDFVDRGSYSLENVVLLLAWKVLLPDHFFMSRGNHESIGLNRMYGFDGEVKEKYDNDVFMLFQEVFHALPLGHTINGKVFVTHGGLFSKDNVTISDIQKVNRFRDIPDEGLMVEMLWSDPQPSLGRAKSKRGVGVSFGPDVTENFLKTNGFDLVVRSHEVTNQGYDWVHPNKLLTVFSAPNYCDQIGNLGGYLKFNGKEMKPQCFSFSHVQHPGKRAMHYSKMLGGM